MHCLKFECNYLYLYLKTQKERKDKEKKFSRKFFLHDIFSYSVVLEDKRWNSKSEVKHPKHVECILDLTKGNTR